MGDSERYRIEVTREADEEGEFDWHVRLEGKDPWVKLATCKRELTDLERAVSRLVDDRNEARAELKSSRAELAALRKENATHLFGLRLKSEEVKDAVVEMLDQYDDEDYWSLDLDEHAETLRALLEKS